MRTFGTLAAPILDHWALGVALNRFRFRNPFHEDTLFPQLSLHDQDTIVREAFEIQFEARGGM